MRNSNSRFSMYSQPKKTIKVAKQDTLQLCQSTQQILDQASKVLSHHEFSPIFEKTIKNLISKAEIQSPNSQSICLESIKQCLSIYGGSLELNLRTLLLEILSELNCNTLQETTVKLEKAKHIVLQTDIEYLLSKIFLLEEKYYLAANDTTNALKCLRKCLDLNEEHMIQFMQEEEEIRKQIVDYAIVAYYEYFKIAKTEKPVQSLEILMKACNAAKKNYGRESPMTTRLLELYRQQQNMINSMDKASTKSRAVTDILQTQNRKNYKTIAFYSWEDEKINVQLLKVKGRETQVFSETSYDIKLDMNQIRLLKSTEWIAVQKGGEVVIIQDELLRILGYTNTNPNQNNENNQKQMTTTAGLKNLSKDLIMKKTFFSSSEDDEQFFSKQELNALKFPRAQSSRKFKDTQ